LQWSPEAAKHFPTGKDEPELKWGYTPRLDPPQAIWGPHINVEEIKSVHIPVTWGFEP